MGTQEVSANLTSDEKRAFMKALLNDARAMERMLELGRIESGVRRIGAEQELVLVDHDWQPAPKAMEILDDIEDARVTTEIARFNLEFNLDPLLLTGNCLSRLEIELDQLLRRIRAHAKVHGAEVLLTGCCPTLSKSHLGRENISDRARYFALDEALTKLRGGAYELAIKGTDELTLEHDSVMLEALNTSFQIHYQTGAEEFPALYNIAQAVAAPLLSVCCNSPVLFAKRLWRETRIAIFQQTVDTRGHAPHERDLLPRVRFGEGWVDESVLELFQQDIARFRIILGREIEEDSLAEVEAGHAPALHALQLHNSTVYRWNRACYGVKDDVAHLRIENRVLPAGPTVVDEAANAAFWFGLMAGGEDAFGDVKSRLDFDDARSNFVAAARQGLNSEISWFDGRTVPSSTLVREELLDVARHGLEKHKIDADDIDRYLGLINDRVKSRQTGAQWLLSSVAAMKQHGTRGERLTALTAATFSRQQTGRPGHLWALASLREAGGWKQNYQRIEQYMTTDLFTVHEDELIDLVASLMDWERIRHVPVEDADHKLVGLVSYRALLRAFAREGGPSNREIPVKDIMERTPVTVHPHSTTFEAIDLMRKNGVACLPVTDTEGRLVGIVTEYDFLNIAAQLFEEHLATGAKSMSAAEPEH